MEINNVEMSKIRFSKEANARIGEIERDCHGLMNSIKEEGLLQPIGVIENEDSTYTIRFGNRRFIACKKLGFKTIDTIPAEGDLTEVDLIIQNLTENHHRKNLGVIELGHGCKALQKQGLNTAEIAVRLGMSKSAIQTAIELYEIIPVKHRPVVQFQTSKNRNITAGTISALTAKWIAKVGTRFSLSKSDIEKMFDYALAREIPFKRVSIIGFLINQGMTLDKAIKKSETYTIHELSIALENDERDTLMKEYNAKNFAEVMQKMLSKKISSLIVTRKMVNGKEISQ